MLFKYELIMNMNDNEKQYFMQLQLGGKNESKDHKLSNIPYVKPCILLCDHMNLVNSKCNTKIEKIARTENDLLLSHHHVIFLH